MRSLLVRGVLFVGVWLVGCSAPPVVEPKGPSVLVSIEFEAGLQSRCVKVTALNGASERESKPVLLETSPVSVTVYAQAAEATARFSARGYTDDGCTVLTSPLEETEALRGTYGEPPGTLTLHLRRPGADGGVDAGSDAGMPRDAGMSPDAGPDAGTSPDAGIDGDQDGYPLPADCDDSDPAVHPGVAEVCTNGRDDDCDLLVDCNQGTCDQFVCAGNGRCTSGVCAQAVETSCNDGFDNDADSLTDCLDPDCTGSTCSDNDSCSTGDTCVADGGCQSTGVQACTAGLTCFTAVGTCTTDGGSSFECVYAPTMASCDDGLACTTGDQCGGGVCTAGTAVVCGPAAVCHATPTCAEPSGTCVSPLLAAGTGACSDADNCTVNDTCDGDGGCVGTRVSCPLPSQCHQNLGTCAVDGGCQFTSASGQSCDAGAGTPATCDGTFNCVVTPVFSYTPTNFTEADMVRADGGAALTLTDNVTLNTDSLTVTAGTLTVPASVVITPAGGQPTVLFTVNGLNVGSAFTLTLTGSRPAIFASVGPITIDGTIDAQNGGGTSSACGNGGAGNDSGAGSGEGGAGGGGFGSVGRNGAASGGNAGTGGAINGNVTLFPLRGGCKGGTTSPGGTLGGVGGGAVQLASTGQLTINGRVGAAGGGGAGATQTARSGGGGGSGGGVLLEGVTVVLSASARVTANGGGGGEGGATGASGSAGRLTDATVATGGAGGSTNGGNGGPGAAGSTAAGLGLVGNSNNDGSGGGGGGVGRIRVQASGSCTIDAAAIVSPAATSNGATGCP